MKNKTENRIKIKKKKKKKEAGPYPSYPGPKINVLRLCWFMGEWRSYYWCEGWNVRMHSDTHGSLWPRIICTECKKEISTGVLYAVFEKGIRGREDAESRDIRRSEKVSLSLSLSLSLYLSIYLYLSLSLILSLSWEEWTKETKVVRSFWPSWKSGGREADEEDL